MSSEAIREVRGGVRPAVPLTSSSEIILPILETPRRPFGERAANALLDIVIGNTFRLVEVCGTWIEIADEWVDRDHGRYMEELRRVRY